MPVDLTNIARTPKDSHIDTIRYELAMLEFCFEKLSEIDDWASDADRYVYLESFLLHYRNLIQFFASNGHSPNSLNIKNAALWIDRALTEEEKNSLQTAGRDLVRKHWENISRYLQHCTTDRHDTDISWNIVAMHKEIEPVIDGFNSLFT